jgi:hypothetical protein
MTELGVTGLKRFGGIIRQEFLTELTGSRGREAFTEMWNNDPVVGAMMHLIEQSIRGAIWDVQGGSEQHQEFLGEMMDDMSFSWNDFISEVLTMFPYGWSLFEVVYKRRKGPWSEPRSKHSDGKIGWRKFAIRGQHSLHHWEFDDEGGIEAMVQNTYPTRPGTATIPIAKALLFRTSVHLNNPEGKSVLRSSYLPWYYAQQLRTIEAIGVERDLVGMPMIWLPQWFSDADLTNAEKLISRLKRDELEGVTIPGPRQSELFPQGWDFELLGGGGQRSFNISEMIQRYEQRMALAMLVQFIFLGISGVGSYALSETFMDTFYMSLNGWADSMASVLNRFAVPPLFRLNGKKENELPEFTVSIPSKPDLQKLSAFGQFLVMSGFDISDLEDHLRGMADLPTKPEDEEVDEFVEERIPTEDLMPPTEMEQKLAAFARAVRKQEVDLGRPLNEEEALADWEVSPDRIEIARLRRLYPNIPELQGEPEEEE